MVTKFWRHAKSGEVWAVEFGADGELIGSCGPLPYDEISPDDYFNFTAEDVDWLLEHDGEFVPHHITTF